MAVVNNVINDFFNLPRTDETRQNYVDFQAGKIDIFGNPKGTNLAESMANPGGMLSETNVEQQTTENNVSEAPSMLSEESNISQRQANIKQELEKQYAVLKSQGFDYVNDSDLDYIFTEQAKEFANAGLESIYDLGKRTEKINEREVEVEQFNDPATGKTKYRYTTGMNIGGMKEKTIEVDPTLVKPVSKYTGAGNTETIYMASLPNEMPVLFNKKTGETVDVFQGKGTLYGGGEEATVFGNLYSGVEGGAALNVKFAGDSPIFYPLYQDTSDRNLVTAATMAGTVALSPFAMNIGNTLVPQAQAGTILAKSAGMAAIAGGSRLAIGGDLEDALLAATMAYGTTYGVDALTSGKFGDYLIDNNILDAETVDFLKIPTDSSLKYDTATLDAFNLGLKEPPLSGLGEELNYNLLDGTTPPTFNTPQILEDASGLSLLSDQTMGTGTDLITSLPKAGESTTFDGLLSGTQKIDELPFLAGEGTPNITGSMDNILGNITNAEGATVAVTDVLKNIAAGTVTATAANEVIEEASKFIDLKEVFGDTFGGLLENVAKTGIDYKALELLQEKAEQAGEDIQKDYEGVFKPITVRTGLGVTDFGINPETGQAEATSVRDAKYEPIQTSALDTAKSLFQDLPTTRADATAKQLAATRALNEPERQRQQEEVFGRLQRQGTRGLGITRPTVGGQRRINPLAESLFAAQEQARALEGLAAEKYGLTEAGRQADLGVGLLGTSQNIDEKAREFASLQNLSNLRQTPELRGLDARKQYDLLALAAEIDRIRGLSSFGKGLFGLPTEQGNIFT